METIITNYRKNNDYCVARTWTDVKTLTIAKKLEYGNWKYEETSLGLVQHIPGCKDASLQDIASWMKDDGQYEIADEEILAFVKCHDNEIEDHYHAH